MGPKYLNSTSFSGIIRSSPIHLQLIQPIVYSILNPFPFVFLTNAIISPKSSLFHPETLSFEGTTFRKC